MQFINKCAELMVLNEECTIARFYILDLLYTGFYVYCLFRGSTGTVCTSFFFFFHLLWEYLAKNELAHLILRHKLALL